MLNRKILSFNVGTTHFMHFNKAERATKGETHADKTKRSHLIKQVIGENILNHTADFLCIQEGFLEVLPSKYAGLSKITDYPVPHGRIADYNTSFLSTYVNSEKYDAVENKQIDVDYKVIYPRKPCKTQVFEITDKKTRKQFILVNFHGLGIPDTRIRLSLLNFVKNFIETNYPRKEVIIVGDINTNLRKTDGEQDEIDFCEHVRENVFRNYNVFPENDRVQSSYHRYIFEDDGSITNKPRELWNDTLDYCLIKSRDKYKVTVKRIPKKFAGKQVPYKTLPDRRIEPNFEEFPSDHTLNLYILRKQPRLSRPRPFKRGIKRTGKKSKKRTKSQGNSINSNLRLSSNKSSSTKKRRGSF